ncbi:MAG: exosporium leader peptide-containing protein [Caulobacteraceae bacterium]|nr:exosporium leader peptide-containing protein [Caulobacteraceae bacterium]
MLPHLIGPTLPPL